MQDALLSLHVRVTVNNFKGHILRYTYPKNLFTVYLKCKFNQASVFYPATLGAGNRVFVVEGFYFL